MQKNATNMQQIFKKYAQYENNMQQIYKKYARNTKKYAKICKNMCTMCKKYARYAKIMQEICKTYARNMQRICIICKEYEQNEKKCRGPKITYSICKKLQKICKKCQRIMQTMTPICKICIGGLCPTAADGLDHDRPEGPRGSRTATRDYIRGKNCLRSLLLRRRDPRVPTLGILSAEA